MANSRRSAARAGQSQTLWERLVKPFAKARRVLKKRRFRDHPRHVSFPGVDAEVLDCRIAYNDHGAYCVPWHLRSRPASRKVFAGEVYEQETIERMIALSRGGDIVHAGTFFGDFLPVLERGMQGEGRIWAFEPNLESFRCADITRQLNKLERVTLTHAGPDDSAGLLHIQTPDGEGKPLGGKSYLVETAGPGTESVQVATVDDSVPGAAAVTVLQLDVEGFEQAALEGAMMTIQRCRPAIILETLPDAEWLEKNLYALGYRMDGRVNRNYVLVN